MHSEAFAFLEITGREHLMTVYAYCDESGKHHDHEVVSVAAVLGRLDQIRSFEREWRYWLREKGLELLTMKEALNRSKPLSGAHSDQGLNERNVALLPFVDCLKKHLDILTGVAIDVRSFERMSPEAHKQLTTNPNYTAFAKVVLDLLGRYQDDTLSIICDDEERAAPRIYRLYRKLKRTYPRANTQLASLCLADDKIFYSLQGADMIASLVRLEARKRICGEPYDYETLFGRLTTKLDISPQAQVSLGVFGGLELTDLSQTFIQFEKNYGRYGVAPFVEDLGMKEFPT